MTCCPSRQQAGQQAATHLAMVADDGVTTWNRAPRSDKLWCVRPRRIHLLGHPHTDVGGPGVLADPGPFPRFMALLKYALGVQRLGCQEGGCRMSTEGQISVDIRQFLTDYSATSTAPSAISATPSQFTVSFSPRNKHAEDCDQHDAQLVDGRDLCRVAELERAEIAQPGCTGRQT